MSKLGYLLAFVLGVAAGATGGYLVAKSQYEPQIDSMRDTVRELVKKNTQEENEELARKALEKPAPKDYLNKVEGLGYTKYSDAEDVDDEEKPNEPAFADIRIITEDEYGDQDDYNLVQLSYFTDGVLAEGDDIIDDMEEIIGLKSNLDKFNEEGLLYIRNDEKQCDYEILMEDHAYYSENDGDE